MSKNNNVDISAMEMFIPDGEEQIPKVEINTHSFSFNHHNVYLDHDIDEPKYYRALFSLLDAASDLDSFKFIIDTDGGRSDTMLHLMSSIEKTSAHTVAEIHKAYSAGSCIALSCDEISVMSFSTLMIHKGSMGMGGTANEVETHVDFNRKHDKEVFEKIYKDFLTDEEIQNVLDGKTYYFNAEEIKERAKKMADLSQGEDEEETDNDGEKCESNEIVLENFNMGEGL